MIGRRELLRVGTDTVVGAVQIGLNGVVFDQYAGTVFRYLRQKLGDEAAAQMLVDDGWSNGALYLGDVAEVTR